VLVKVAFFIEIVSYPQYFRTNGSLYERHKAVTLGAVGILCAMIMAVYPLSYACRRRKRRRRSQPFSSGLSLDEGSPSSPAESRRSSRGANIALHLGMTEDVENVQPENDGGYLVKIQSRDPVVNEMTPLVNQSIKPTGNQNKPTKLSELAPGLRKPVAGYYGSELVIKGHSDLH
jgi:hypothetical protein